MRILTTISTGIALAMLSTTPAAAGDAKIYAVPSHENFCPAGLQPVTISGVICCGVPNQQATYHQVMQHPTPKKKVHKHYSARAHCPVGTKGCS